MVKSFVRKLLILFAAAIVAVYSGCARKEAGKSYREAYEKYEQGLYVEAVNGFLLAVSQGEDSGRIYGDLALSYVKLKEYAKAEDAVGKAIEKAGEDDGTLLRVGLYYLETEDFEKARTYLEQASGAEKKKLSELNLTAIGYLAELDEKETRYEDAIERYKSLISNGFKATESKLFIGECYLRLKQ